jgi:hypothetical protein
LASASGLIRREAVAAISRLVGRRSGSQNRPRLAAGVGTGD